jgi:hypothetical protein
VGAQLKPEALARRFGSTETRGVSVNMTLPSDPEPRAEYSEAEFVRILRTAAALQDRSTGGVTSEKMALAEIEQIAAEVGIAPQYIAAAAVLVITEAGEQWRYWLAVPVQGRLSRVLPGSVSDNAWQELVAVIRQTLEHTGQHSYVPGALEWVHTDDLSVVRVEVSASEDRSHAHVFADHRQAAALYLSVGPLLGACATVLPMAVFGWGEAVAPWILFSGGAGAGFAVGWASFKARSARWQRRLRGLLQALAERGMSTSIED